MRFSSFWSSITKSRFEAPHPFRATGLKLWVCPHVSREPHVGNDVGSDQEVQGTGVRIERRLQGTPECAVHYRRKGCCTQIQQWPWKPLHAALNRSASEDTNKKGSLWIVLTETCRQEHILGDSNRSQLAERTALKRSRMGLGRITFHLLLHIHDIHLSIAMICELVGNHMTRSKWLK